MLSDHGNPRIAVVLYQDGYRFINCTPCQDGDCDVTVRTLYEGLILKAFSWQHSRIIRIVQC